MITDLIYRCPLCGGFDWLESGSCIFCNAHVDLISRSHISINGDTQPISDWYRKVLSFDLPDKADGSVLKSNLVNLSREVQNGPYKGFGGIFAIHFTRRTVDTGTVTMYKTSLTFSGKALSIEIPFQKITSMTIESNTIIVVSSEHGPLFFDFLEESGKKWEDFFQKALRKFHAPEEIVEFYPRIRFRRDLKERPAKVVGHPELKPSVHKWYPSDYSPLFAVLKTILRPIIKKVFSVTANGLENIPEHGPAIITPNHTSFLDSIILGALPNRHIWFMAKNSEYRHLFLKWFLTIGNAFPVRRYTNDVLAVRNAARIVQGGHILGIYPEGERTWDGKMLPLRYGTIRLILALAAPVIPVGINGAYELMPRWTGAVRKVPVTINIGKPVRFEHIPIPKQTRRDIESASRLLRSEITKLSGVKS